MPLSDHEQQILHEIERQFYEQDPKFARAVSPEVLQAQAIRNFRRGIALFVLGFVALGFFFLRPAALIGVGAFLMMLAGATFAYHNARKLGVQGAPGGSRGLTGLFGGFEDRLKDIRRRRES